MWWGNDVTTPWGGVPNGTLWMMFTCCPIFFLASPSLELNRFHTGHFVGFEQFKIDSYVGTAEKPKSEIWQDVRPQKTI